jgi:photosystem II stability/assembly factor-like uncharacterized protein
MKYVIVCIWLLFTAQLVTGQTITLTEQGKPTSIRGLSVVDDHVAWVSGSKGHVGSSTNSGQTWTWQQVKGFEQSDFRDIEAFSDKEAIIMSSGTPAVILKTIDGGTNWKEVYRQDDKAYFLDAMAFANAKHGYTMGDPINGKFLLLETIDGGQTWHKSITQPLALPGEAAFAASGTCFFASERSNELVMVTGGTTARKITINGGKVTAEVPPIAQGQSATGIFSYAVGSGYEVFTGGNYEKDKRTDSVACYRIIAKQRAKPILAQTQPAGYQSCVAYLQGSTFLSTGTPGSNITTNGGKSWKQIDTNSYNVCQKAKNGNLIIIAGDKGKVAVFKL